MPRIPDQILDCVIYLYPSEDASQEGVIAGASGFLVSVPSAMHKGYSHTHAVTNAHALERGSSVIRLNTKKGEHRTIPLQMRHWLCHPKGDDVAVSDSLLGLVSEYQIKTIPENMFVTDTEIARLDIGIGDDVFMAGRFGVVAGIVRNQPSLRFGNISMMPSEKIPIHRKFDGQDFYQEAYLVEMRSLTGYSGSPVMVYSTGTTPDFLEETIGIRMPYMKLLGVNCAHLPDHENRPSNMACVVPAQILRDLLYDEEMMEKRKLIDEEMKRQLNTQDRAVSDSLPDETDEFTKADFEKALKKVSRSDQPQSDKGTSETSE